MPPRCCPIDCEKVHPPSLPLTLSVKYVTGAEVDRFVSFSMHAMWTPPHWSWSGGGGAQSPMQLRSHDASSPPSHDASSPLSHDAPSPPSHDILFTTHTPLHLFALTPLHYPPSHPSPPTPSSILHPPSHPQSTHTHTHTHYSS